MNTTTVRQRILPRMSLNTHRRDCQPNLLRSPATAKSVPTVNNLTDGLKNAALIRFVTAVLQEPESQCVMALPVACSGAYAWLPEQRLRAAAQSTLLYPAPSRMQSDVTYTATVILGLQNLMKAAATTQFAADEGNAAELGGDLLANGGQEDVFRSIVRPALYKLEAEAPIHAGLLRIALNWGNQDEMMDGEAQRMQSIVRQSSRGCAARLQTMKRHVSFSHSGEVRHGQV